MAIYKFQNGKTLDLREADFQNEKELHVFIENNLDELLGLKKVSSEYQIEGYFIDTLAYDSSVNSFVVIEYKRDRSFSVFDQGMHYLSLLLNNKAQFVLDFNNKNKKNNKIEDFDWSQSKVIFISRSFTSYQKGAINFKDLPIELWEIIKYEGDLIDLHQVESSKKAESINKFIKDSNLTSVTKELKTYSVEDHFKPGWTNSKEIYEVLREKLLNIDNRLIEDPKKYFIGFKLGRLNVFSTEIYMSYVQLSLPRTKPQDIKDPEKRLVLRKNSMKFYGQEISDFKIYDVKDIDYAAFLAKQVYENFIKNH